MRRPRYSYAHGNLLQPNMTNSMPSASFAAQAAQDAGMDDLAIYAVELSMDEACTNIIEHAYEGVEGAKSNAPAT